MSRIRNILAPTDFSTNSSQAIAYACDLAKFYSADLHLLYVHNGDLDERMREAQMERLHRLIDPSSELELNTTRRVATGHPANCISRYARNHKIDAIIMGTHGRSGLAHLAIGSVTENVIKDAPCPVTVLGPSEGESISLGNAIDVVESIVGSGLKLSEAAGRELFTKELVGKLRIPTTTAILMVDQLIDQQWLFRKQECWKIVEGTEFLDGVEIPMQFDESTDSQAVDLVKRAMKLRATDIHIDPINNSEYQIRMRIDGGLQKYCELDKTVGEHLIGQLKTLAALDIADPFHPQEGRLVLTSTLRDSEVRVSTVPVLEGQAAALRILDATQIFKPLAALGFGDDRLAVVQNMIQKEGGLVLVTGPTGCGKTTTVYSMLETIQDETKNIVSIEDPVEFSAPFVRQLSTNDKTGLTMSTGIRTLLRMDPDVLFIGEIRDVEAAQIAMRAASSGKTVFSTLHTRDVASTIQALLDLGLTGRSVANQLAGIVNQRLAKRLCPQCRRPVAVDATVVEVFQMNSLPVPDRLFECAGCSVCNKSGFRGRIGVFECAIVGPDLRHCIEQSASVECIRSYLTQSGTKSLTQDALSKAADGLISIQQAIGIQWIN